MVCLDFGRPLQPSRQEGGLKTGVRKGSWFFLSLEPITTPHVRTGWWVGSIQWV